MSTTAEFQYDVLLSHSSKDKAVVRAVAERLRKDGLRVWFDEWVLKPGDSIPAKIEAGLEHSRVLVLCMSANAFGSDWAQLEAGTFRFRDPLNKERRFIPLRLDDAPIKGSLAQFLFINWRPPEREQEYAKLLAACRGEIELSSNNDSHAQDNHPDQVSRLNRNDLWIPLLEFIAGAGFFGASADVLDDFGFHKPKIIAHCVGLIVMELAIAHLLFKAFRQKAKLIWCVYVTVVVLEVFLVATVAREPTLKPKIIVSVLPRRDQPAIPMTNDYLMLGKLRMSGSNEYLLGTLVIPVVPPAPARLELLVSNESTNSPAEFVEVTTIRGTNLVMSEEAGGDIHWKEVVTPGESNLCFAALILPGAILPTNGRSLPVLIFENAKDFIDRYLMFKISLASISTR